MKILNLNLWNYNKFDERKPNIIKFIQKHRPDIVAFQEVRDDLRFNSKGNNQAKQLNKFLGYKYIHFVKTMDVNKVNKTFDNPACSEGVAILSKYPLIRVTRRLLKRHPEDEYTRGILYAKVKAERLVDIFVVHYSPNDLFSKLHLQETLTFAENHSLKPIIIGDFNIRNPKILENLIGNKYMSSYQVKKYISYPPADYTLDYILIPKGLKFRKLSCLGTNVSDHKALIAEINF